MKPAIRVIPDQLVNEATLAQPVQLDEPVKLVLQDILENLVSRVEQAQQVEPAPQEPKARPVPKAPEL